MCVVVANQPDSEVLDLADLQKVTEEEAFDWLLADREAVQVTMTVKDLDTGEVYAHAEAKRK